MHETGNEARDEANVQQAGGGGLCGATARDGRPCHAPCLKGGSFCYMHEPTKASERKEASKRGGASTSSRRRLLLGRVDFGSLASIRGFREALTAAALTGQIAANRATVALAAARDAEGSLRGPALEARMQELEKLIAELEGLR
jgi:hypothetical protein